MPAGNPGRPLFLASVVSAAEATAALAAGAEIIDCKNPSAGALGALPHETVRLIVETVAGRVPVSATVGDLPPDPQHLCAATAAMAGTGVDLVKVGFFDGGEPEAAIAALGRTDLGRARLVGLLLADRDPDFGLVAAMRKAGFAGVMLDTATKDGRSLAEVMSRQEIDRFITSARASGLFVGLAGALRAEHIPNLGDLTPDLMGFRGALCSGKMREGPLEEAAARVIATALASLGRPSAARLAILEAAP
ncbi:MAG: (5-formylfuran-3-yl)methyl phosphate synthase [Deltaproteobacteria bacterium]